MSADKSKTSRRAFVMSGGATLGAGVAAAVAAKESSTTDASQADREAIRLLHAQFIAGVESATLAGAAPTHRAYRANALQAGDTLMVSANRRAARATWNVDVKKGMELEGNSTIVQMARLQGMLDNVHWETGRLEARYEKAGGGWQMTAVSYTAA